MTSHSDATSKDADIPHCVAIIGGAVSGAEIAGRLADHGAWVVVFDQNPRPYGKIEDGLPRWHHRLRDKEYAVIREKLSRPMVEFVPCTKIGRDLDFSQLTREWGFSAVVLTCGAWRDRPLPIEGQERYIDKGLIYQNAFVTWFNHLEEAGYEGEEFEILDDAIVVGGGLASIDVAKILMLETTRAKLSERGIEVAMIDLETKGIPKVLELHGLEFSDLGLKGCTIYYRRRIEDMPVVSVPSGASPEQEQKVQRSRTTLIEKAMRKFCFAIEPLAAPNDFIAEDGKLVGIKFQRTRIEDGQVLMSEEFFERRGSCVISSIGSIPEPIPGIDMKGELFNFSDWDLGRMSAYPTVFSAGNVVTGKGNIAVSRKHASHVAEDSIETFLGITDVPRDQTETPSNSITIQAEQTAREISAHLYTAEKPTRETVDRLRERIRKRQGAVGYPGDLETWIEQVTPKPR
jgi:ferredoxin--NADP+ reductase